ncbi:hypothetical protein P280DRAFT_464746 [Massarina eburnea CBS 473.64]|uniref:Actin-like ATPase domain-containing protein n=1 Tax=Massarina eburnea CBS 473.64 TaxID=1395130 RepID=A0A6A6SGT9_9PLEO|nr:hypothetical protein P280DRAFT_464746 [Massarina eburnea CBS 473.64]
MGSQKPHMVVGIDLGMTCTGVAYANLSIGSSTVRWVQKWPGRMNANENKVPTVIVYPYDDPTPSSWGFLSENTAEGTARDKEYKEWFKTCLDPERLAEKQREDPEDAPESIEEVEKCYGDYLRKMYSYLDFKLGGELSGTTWENARIEFIFSVPTTWPPIPVVESFRRIIKDSGFGTHPNHVVSIGLTEAEAAAVHISTEAPGIFRSNDILLVCDAGGGTTDLSVLRVNAPPGNTKANLSLQQLDVVLGQTIGSAAIDYDFEKMVAGRLKIGNETAPLGIDYADAAWEMMKSTDFQAVKCEYGSPDDTPRFSIPIPRISHTYNNSDPEVRIRAGEMLFEEEDLRRLFDKQIHKLFSLIDAQLEILNRKLPNEQVTHLVLSGGLGNSAYVQQRLRQYYSSSTLPNTRSLSLRISPDPQLAVCKGLVSDRIRKLLTQQSVLGSRCCRSSYGTMCKILYDKRNPEHTGKDLVKDPLNGKMYIMEAIAWFVKKGEPVSVDIPIVHSFVKKVTPGDSRIAFPTSVIESSLEASELPTQMNPDTRILCEISSDLSTASQERFVEKNKNFWSVGKRYYRVEYEIHVLIGPADIRFELWFDNKKLSKDHSIKVDWMPAPDASPAAPLDLNTFGRTELEANQPTHMSGGLAKGSAGKDGLVVGGIGRWGSGVERREGSGSGNGEEGKMRRGMRGMIGIARGLKG